MSNQQFINIDADVDTEGGERSRQEEQRVYATRGERGRGSPPIGDESIWNDVRMQGEQRAHAAGGERGRVSPPIGIDLGTTTSCVGIWINGGVKILKNEFGLSTTPSVVHYGKNPDNQTPIITVGKAAVSRLARNPTRTLHGVKRLIGRSYQVETAQQFNYQIIPDSHGNNLIRLAGDLFLYPEQVSAEVLKKMKQIAENYLGMEVSKAVITVPAYFTDNQRYATRVAAEIAGLETIRMINEPTAGCLCYGIDQSNIDCRVLVFDIGGGTTDVSLLSLHDGLFEVLATSGDSDLGGIDFDQCLLKYLLEKYQIVQTNPSQLAKLLEACEQLKIQLSVSDQASFTLDLTESEDELFLHLTYQEWLPIIRELIERAKTPVLQVLQDSHLNLADIGQVILIGGSSRMRPLHLMLKELFPHQKLNHSVNPDEAVAYGAAIQARLLTHVNENDSTNEMVLIDVTPLSLGIETEGGLMSVIIPRNTNIPCLKTAYYTTVIDDQTEVEVEIFHGERPLTCDNQKLGRFRLTGIQPMGRGLPKIRVEFQMTVDGILEIRAVDENSGTNQQITIDSTNVRISKEELAVRLEEAKNKLHIDEVKRTTILERKNLLNLLQDLRQLLSNQNGETSQLSEQLDHYQSKIANTPVSEGDYQTWKKEIEAELVPQFNHLFVRPELIPSQPELLRTEDELNGFLETFFV